MTVTVRSYQYTDAASLAYENMLQEDFSNKITLLLSLHACVKRLEVLCTQPEAEEEPPEVDEDVSVRFSSPGTHDNAAVVTARLCQTAGGSVYTTGPRGGA